MTTKNEGKIYSFWSLLKEQKIEIPIIQRDYAQGRKDKQEIRDEFLAALCRSLTEQKQVKLDFIYGSKLGDTFLPLDGQQRLTTLFLLHWYAALKDSKLNDETTNILLKFSYETRSSSREFCHELIKNKIVVTEDTNKISDHIINSSWFFLSWKKDPTIDAMLRTIDDIHKVFYNTSYIWEKLSEENCLISFYHVDLDNFGLTDDLYIKMNARGKLLTHFENFKAIFQKHVDDHKWETEKDFQNTFAYKIDTVWTDLFWSHRKDNSVDAPFIRFISTIIMIQSVLERAENRADIIMNIQRRPENVRVDHFTKAGYTYLCECLDAYHNIYVNDTNLNLNVSFWQHQPGENIFSALVYEGSISASYTQKVLFYAQTEYMRRNVNEFSNENFNNWMRVIRNIISRGDAEKTGKRPSIIRSPDTFIGVINLIKELSEGCENIYQFLSSETIKSSFAKEQIEEEILKAKLIIQDTSYTSIIFSVEDTNFCQGKIQFPLYCIDYHKHGDVFSIEQFKKIKAVIDEYLNEEHISNDFRRGLLATSVDDKYSYYNYWWSWSAVADGNKRCLIARYRELEYYIYGTKNNIERYRDYVKRLFLNLTKKTLKNFIKDFVVPDNMPNWKKRLIKEDDLLDYKCKSHYIAIPEDESCCYLLKGQRPRKIEDCVKIE